MPRDLLHRSVRIPLEKCVIAMKWEEKGGKDEGEK
jgi:hypothetical protein